MGCRMHARMHAIRRRMILYGHMGRNLTAGISEPQPRKSPVLQ
jgi:hypothetical protein